MKSLKFSMDWFLYLNRYINRSNKTKFRDIGRAAAAARQWCEAVDAYQKHLLVRPRDGQTWLRLANILKDTGNFEASENAYARACAVMPDASQAWLNRGHLAKLDGRHSDALIYYKRSFILNGSAAAGREIQSLGGGGSIIGGAYGIVGTIDTVVGGSISGWAVDPEVPEGGAKVEFLQAGIKLAEVHADLPRVDVLSAGFGTSLAGFRLNLGEKYNIKSGPITARLVSSARELCNSPYYVDENDWLGRWLERSSNKNVEDIKLEADNETDGYLLSIVMPVYNAPLQWLSEAIDSVLNQYCSRWQLVCVDDSSTDPRVYKILEKYSQNDSRIKVLSLKENKGISGATNCGIEVASGDYIAFMDQDDYLEPEAVYRVLKEAQSNCDLIYTDEVIVGSEIDDIIDVVARPAFSYSYYISHPYFVHFVAVRADLVRAVGGLDEGMPISMDVDFILRVLERAKHIVHVPVPLYRWRTHSKSAGHVMTGKVMDATREALQRHHDRLGVVADVTNGKTFNTFHHNFDEAGGRVLVIIPTKNRLDLLAPCVDSVLRTTDDSVDIVIIDHESSDLDIIEYFKGCPERVKVLRYCGEFNYSRMNNNAFFKCAEGYDYVLFLNNDVEAIQSGWLEHMRGLCQMPSVGAVGALLLYGDGSVQHGGVVLGVGGVAEHAYKGEQYLAKDFLNAGYLSGLVTVRDCMAVTGACMLVKSDVFRQVNGFDEDLAIGFNDVDLCLRLKELNYSILLDASSVLYHYESATRSLSRQLSHPEDTNLFKNKWKNLLSRSDFYFSPYFSKEAPVSFSVAKEIDIFSKSRVWKRASEASL